MSLFLSKLLPNRPSHKTEQELLVQTWLSIQHYYETAQDALNDTVELTPIPNSLKRILKLIKAESSNLGPCLEYVIQDRVLEELVEFANVDTPFGMRGQCLEFFTRLVQHVSSQVLPAIHRPLQKLVLATPHSLGLVRLIHAIMRHFKGTAMVDLFFERGWCRGWGESIWRAGLDGTINVPSNHTEEIQWNRFLMPRFDLFTLLMEMMNMAGETGELARETLLLALQLVHNDPEYACYILEYSGFCKIMADRLAFLFTNLLPLHSDNDTDAISNLTLTTPTLVVENQPLITMNAPTRLFLRPHKTNLDIPIGTDAFYSFWEYLNDITRIADPRLMVSLLGHLVTRFWHPVLGPRLLTHAIPATSLVTDMIRSLTDPILLDGFLVVVLDSEPLRTLLIRRMTSSSLDLSLATLRLFDTVLETWNQHAVLTLMNHAIVDTEPDQELIEKVLALLPLDETDQRRNYDDYFYEARERFEYSLLARHNWHPATSPPPPSTNPLFLNTLLTLFESVLDAPMEQNLIVTSLLQKLATVMDASTLFNVLEPITTEAMVRARAIPGFETRLVNAKNQHGVDPAEAIYQELKSVFFDPPPSPSPSIPTHTSFIDGYIVLQEFCKELAALLLVSSTSPK